MIYWRLEDQVFLRASLDVVFNDFKRIPASSRSSLLDVFCGKGVPKNFSKFTRKLLYGSFFFNKVATSKSVTLSKMRPQFMCFPMNFVNFIRNFKHLQEGLNTYIEEHLQTAASVLPGSIFVSSKKFLTFLFFIKAETCLFVNLFWAGCQNLVKLAFI